MADIDDFIKPEKSLLNLDSEDMKGDLGLSNFVLESLAFDTMAIELVDVNKGGIRVEGGLMFADKDVKTWRRGEVLMVGPSVKHFKVGDIVIFPGSKGISPGTITVRMPDNSIRTVTYGHFIAEDRVFGTISSK